MVFFYSDIFRVSLWRRNYTPLSPLFLIRMFFCFGGSSPVWFKYSDSFPSPPKITSSPALSRAPTSCFQQPCCLPWMSNRPGTLCIQAALCSGIVIPSYVCTPDVLLTSIDFFTRRTFFFFLKKRQPCRSERHCRD